MAKSKDITRLFEEASAILDKDTEEVAEVVVPFAPLGDALYIPFFDPAGVLERWTDGLIQDPIFKRLAQYFHPPPP